MKLKGKKKLKFTLQFTFQNRTITSLNMQISLQVKEHLKEV